MYFKNCNLFEKFTFLLIIHLFIINITHVSSKNPESERHKNFKEALELRYGTSEKNPDFYKAIPLFEKVADGFQDKIASESLYELGMIYFLGYKRLFKFNYDISKATECFTKSSDMGSPHSQFMLSLFYSFKMKNGPLVDEFKARELLEKSAKSNYVPAILSLAYRYLYDKQSPDVNKSIELYKKVINSENNFDYPNIAFLEGIMINYSNNKKYNNKSIFSSIFNSKSYSNSNSSNFNFEGFEFYNSPDELVFSDQIHDELEKVLNKKYKHSNDSTEYVEDVLSEIQKQYSHKYIIPFMVDLAMMYINGQKLPQNNKIGFQLLDRAVSLGSNIAAYILGYHYYFEYHSLKDPKPNNKNLYLSLKYFKIAAPYYQSDTLYFIADIVERLSYMKGPDVYSSQLPYIYKLFRMSADYGYIYSYIRCAEMLEHGFGVDKDINEAVLYYKVVAEQTMVYVTQWMKFQEMIKENAHSAIVMSLIAAHCGLVYGNWNVASILENTKSSIFDKSIIKQNFNQALLQGEILAINKLANIAMNDGKILLGRELYQRGFEAGDINCIDPLIKLCSKDDIKKAINLIEYKEYRNQFHNNITYDNQFKNYLNSFVNNGTIAILRMKQKLYNILR